jgi:hypothetical protein
VIENSGYPITPELNDEPFTDASQVLSTHLSICPYLLTLTLLMLNNAAYGILFFVNKDTIWKTPIPKPLILVYIAQNIRRSLLHHILVIIIANTNDP